MGVIKGTSLIVISLVFVLQCLSVFCASNFDFYFFVQQWSPSYCNTTHGCCYPTTGKPAEDFGIRGLWPEYSCSGKYPTNCNQCSSLNTTEISDLISGLQKDWPSLACPSENGTKFWGQEWSDHGTCSSLEQHEYFQLALDLKEKANLLQVLKDAGILPGKSYNAKIVKLAIEKGIGHSAFLQCNVNAAGNNQLYQVWLGVDKSGSNFIDYPVPPRSRKCKLTIEIPSFPPDQHYDHIFKVSSF